MIDRIGERIDRLLARIWQQIPPPSADTPEP